MTIQVAVIGKERMDPGDLDHIQALTDARQVGYLLAQANITVLTGGLGGVMEAVSRGVAEAGGISVGIVPVIPEEERSWRWANSFQTVCLNTGLGQRERMPMLIHSCEAVICVSGGQGAWIEAEMALDARIPVVVLPRTGGTALRLTVEERLVDRILIAKDPEEAVDLTLNVLRQRRLQT